MILPFNKILSLVTDAVKAGRTQAQIDMGQAKRFISQREATRLFGRENIRRWRAANLISPAKDGEGSHTLRYDIEKLNELALSTNIHKLLIECEVTNICTNRATIVRYLPSRGGNPRSVGWYEGQRSRRVRIPDASLSVR